VSISRLFINCYFAPTIYKVTVEMRNKKLQVWLPLIFSLVMIAGMYFGFKLHQQTGSTQGFFKTDRRNSLQEALDLINDHYVDKIGVDSLQDDAIEGLMNNLDPHSVYIPATDLSEANEELIGNFQGIGIRFSIFDDTVHVVEVIPNGPSDKAGLKIGDRIIKVADSSVVSKTLPSDDIRKMMRGKAGSQIKLTVVRNNTTQFVHVTRGNIPLPSLDASYMMDAQTGYIKLNKFSSQTYKEFMQAMESLQKSGMKGLILDLRGNGGGFMNEAVAVADEFLDGDKLIVYTQGSNIPKKEYKARKPGLFESGKLVVLVDELSASASEVVAGALQDWDRATVIGRRTFGKGLVQEQYGLSDGSAIRLTVARYYTPLGRSIQRPYDKGKKVYMEEIYERYENGEMLTLDSIHNNNNKQYKTNGGKTLYAGGGIVPDVFVPVDTSHFTHNVTKLYLDGRFNNFVYKYYVKNQAYFQQFKSTADIANRFDRSEDAWTELVKYAEKDSINLKNIPAKDKEDIQERIKAYLARLKFRTEGFYQVANMYDPVIQKAKQELAK
jgi:carboxyl-terminal processing protease